MFGVRTLVSYLSEFMTLHPGNVISTGTPSEVGMSLMPSNYLRPGRVVRLVVDGLGEQHQRTVQG